jgi:protease I
MAIANRKIALLVTDGFEQVELTEPMRALKEAGAKVTLVAPRAGKVQGMQKEEKGDTFVVDQDLSAARPEEFDALVLPGGVANPDTLRADEKAVAFVRAFVEAGKPIGAICHGPWTLIEAGGVRGHTMTSWPSLKSDLTNAGATWVDKPVVVDKGLITSRKPDDLPDFCKAIIEAFGAGTGHKAAA